MNNNICYLYHIHSCCKNIYGKSNVYVFITICNSSCGKVMFLQVSVHRGVVCLWVWGHTPPGRHPTGRHPLGRHPSRQTLPGIHPLGRHPPRPTPAQADNLLGRRPQADTLPRQIPCQANTPQAHTLPGRHPQAHMPQAPAILVPGGDLPNPPGYRFPCRQTPSLQADPHLQADVTCRKMAPVGRPPLVNRQTGVKYCLTPNFVCG